MEPLKARRRVAVDASASPARLTQRGAGVWLRVDDIGRMLELRAAAGSATGFERWKLRRREADLFHGAWGFNGTDEELLHYWAEDRRRDACWTWVKAAPGRSIETFEPFEPTWLDLT